MATLDAEIITCFWQELSNFMADTCKVCHSCFLQSVKTSSTHLKKKTHTLFSLDYLIKHTHIHMSSHLTECTHIQIDISSLTYSHRHDLRIMISVIRLWLWLKNHVLLFVYGCDSRIMFSVICLWRWLKNHVLCDVYSVKDGHGTRTIVWLAMGGFQQKLIWEAICLLKTALSLAQTSIYRMLWMDFVKLRWVSWPLEH